MKKPYYIDFPQEHVEAHMHKYRCAFCKLETTAINGTLEGHLATCEYRIEQEAKGYEVLENSNTTINYGSDEVD